MKKILLKKYFTATLVLFAALIIILVPLGAHTAFAFTADTKPVDPFSCLSNVATCGIYAASLTINAIIGLLITLGGWFIRLGLQLDANIYNSPTVTTGFSVALSLANLGFVLAIIIIAIATILHRETYGIKKLLWKLVVMAILVNFGLVVTSPIVGFANQMTDYFVNAAGGGALNENGAANYLGFVNNLTGAFAPQSLSQPPVTANAADKMQTLCSAATYGLGNVFGACNALAQIVTGQNASTNGTGDFWRALMSLVFGAIFSGVVALTFLAIAALLLVRYVWLGILLVTLPLAWLMWIFPKYSNLFSKWWTDFIKWAFFPPAAIFFIYLAFLTVSRVNNTTNTYLDAVNNAADLSAANGDTPETAIVLQTGQVNPIQTAADEVLLCALMIGGLFAASSLTGKAGGFVVDQAKGVSNVLTGYVGRQTRKAARATYQKAGGQRLTRRLQESRIRPLAAAGRAISSISTNEKLVEDAKKSVPKNPEEIRRNLRGSMSTEDRLAHIAKLAEMNELNEGTMVGAQPVKDFLDTNKDAFEKTYGQGKTLKDVDKALGSDKAMRDAERDIAKGGASAVAAVAKLNTATKDFVEKLQKSDMAKMNVNDIFGKSSPISQALTESLLKYAPQLISSALPKMKSPTLKKFADLYEQAHRDEGARITSDTTLTATQKTDALDKLEEKRKAFKKSLENNVLFSSPDSSAGPAASPPPPTGGTPRP